MDGNDREVRRPDDEGARTAHVGGGAGERERSEEPHPGPESRRLEGHDARRELRAVTSGKKRPRGGACLRPSPSLTTSSHPTSRLSPGSTPHACVFMSRNVGACSSTELSHCP